MAKANEVNLMQQRASKEATALAGATSATAREVKNFSLTAGELGSSLGLQANNLTTLGNKFVKAGQDAMTFGKSTQWIGRQLEFSLTLPIVTAGVVAAKFALDFDATMAKVKSAATETGHQVSDKVYAQMKQAVIDLSMVSVKSLTDISDGFYELVSAGYSVTQSMAMLPQVVEFATAAVITSGDAASFATRMYHAWGQTGIDLQGIMDVTSVAVQKSQAHFPDFMHNLEMSSQFAQQARLSYQDLAVAIMVLSDRGAPLSRIGFNISQMFSQMIHPTKAAADMMDQLGLTYYDATGKMKPMPQILDEIKQSVTGMTDEQKALALNTLFNIRAGRAALSLLQGTSGEYDTYIEKINNASGATKSMADAQKNTPWGRWTIALNKAKAILAEFGEKTLPAFTSILEYVNKLLEGFSNMSDADKRMVVLTLAVLAAIGPMTRYIGVLSDLYGIILKLGGKMLQFAGWIKGGFTALKEMAGMVENVYIPMSGLSFILDAMAPSLLAVVGVVAGAIGIWTEFGAEITDTWNRFGGLAGIMDSVKIAVSDGSSFIKTEWDKIKKEPDISKKVTIVIDDIQAAWGKFLDTNKPQLLVEADKLGSEAGRMMAGGMYTGLIEFATRLIPDATKKSADSAKSQASSSGAELGANFVGAIINGIWLGVQNFGKALAGFFHKLALTTIIKFWDLFGIDMRPVADQLFGVASGLKEIEKSSTGAKLGLSNIPFISVSDAAYKAKAAQDAVTASMNTWLDAVAKHGAGSQQAADAYKAMTDAQAEGTKTSEALTNSLLTQIATTAAAGGSISGYNTTIQILKDSGLITEDQIKKLNAAIAAVPPSKNVDITTNAPAATGHMDALTGAINGIPPFHDVEIRMNLVHNNPAWLLKGVELGLYPDWLLNNQKGGWVMGRAISTLAEDNKPEYILSNPMLQNMKKGVMPSDLLSYLGKGPAESGSQTLSAPSSQTKIIETHTHLYLDRKEIAESVNYHNAGLSEAL
jgi:TP901 family phage tail tape measure protein